MTNPEYMDIDKIFINNIDDIKIIDVIKFADDTKLDALMFRYYGGNSYLNGIDDTLKYLPLILLFNNIPDITSIKVGTFFKFPTLESLLENIEVLIIFDDEQSDKGIPGVSSFTNNLKTVVKNNVLNSKSTTAVPKLNITLPKVNADEVTGIITF